MRIADLTPEDCREIVTSLTETIGRIDAALITARSDRALRHYDKLTRDRAYLIALRNKFVPFMVDLPKSSAKSE